MLGGLLRILVVALVLLVAAMWLMPRPGDFAPPPAVATMLDAPRPLPDVGLIDVNGNPFSFADLNGRHALVFFGFTNCPDICPLTLQVLAGAVEEIRAGNAEIAPAVVFVSVDPARDSPERIGAYVRGFDPSFIGVTADEAALQPLLDALSVTVHKETRDGETYNVVHNGTVYVIDAAGRWTALFGGNTHDAATIASDYVRIRRRSQSE
ncbi:MAG: SCO family protein [Gammaproteobacteria bacterium]|nr:SCO family protein [Gammaproteobacteria bacterium]